MKQNLNKQDLTQLSKFSFEHQCCIVKMLIEDREFQSKAGHLININSLNANPNLRRIAGYVKDLIESNAVFDYDLLDTKLHAEISNAIDLEECETILRKHIQGATLSPSAMEYLKENVYPIIEHQETMRFQGEIQAMLKEGKLYPNLADEVKRLFKEFDRSTLFHSSVPMQMTGSDEETEELLKADVYTFVPTSSRLLNIALGGGLRKSDVGMFLAGSGVGKTCVTSGFVADAAYKDYKVVHFVLEDKPVDIKRKYLAYFVHEHVSDFPRIRQQIQAKLQQYRSQYEKMLSNIRTVYALTDSGQMRRLSVKDIDETLDRLVNEGFAPDMVVVDYYDRIKPSGRSQDIWVRDQETINDLIDTATKYNVAMWVACQAGKAGQNRKMELQMDNIAGGSWKIYAAQVIVAMQKLEEDNGLSTVRVMKNRYLPECKIKVRFENGSCRFEGEQETIKAMAEANMTIEQWDWDGNKESEEYQTKIAKEIKSKSK